MSTPPPPPPPPPSPLYLPKPTTSAAMHIPPLDQQAKEAEAKVPDDASYKVSVPPQSKDSDGNLPPLTGRNGAEQGGMVQGTLGHHHSNHFSNHPSNGGPVPREARDDDYVDRAQYDDLPRNGASNYDGSYYGDQQGHEGGQQQQPGTVAIVESDEVVVSCNSRSISNGSNKDMFPTPSGGYLYKCCKSRTTNTGLAQMQENGSKWVKRYFETIGFFLVYYSSSVKKKVLAALDLRLTGDISMLKADRSNKTFIVMVGGKVYPLRAGNEEEAIGWVNRLRGIKLKGKRVSFFSFRFFPIF